MKEFTKYYPHFNISNIIKKHRKTVKEHRKKAVLLKNKDMALDKF